MRSLVRLCFGLSVLGYLLTLFCSGHIMAAFEANLNIGADLDNPTSAFITAVVVFYTLISIALLTNGCFWYFYEKITTTKAKDALGGYRYF